MSQELNEIVEDVPGPLPSDLPLLAVTDAVIFPGVIFPYVINDARQIKMVHNVLGGNRMMAVFLKKEDGEDGNRLFPTGTAVQVLKMFSVPDGSMGLLLQGIRRVVFKGIAGRSPWVRVRLEAVEEDKRQSLRTESYRKELLRSFDDYSSQNSWISDDLKQSIHSVTDPGQLGDLVCANLNFSVEDRQKVLEETSNSARLKTVLELIHKELKLTELSRKIQDEMNRNMEESQKEHYLREQMKVIRKELGDDDDAAVELEELRQLIAKGHLPEHVFQAAERELKRLGRMSPSSSEFTVSRTYLDWLCNMPWGASQKENTDLKRAARVLDSDHYGLEKVKERILEFLAVRKLTESSHGPILCFAGPPGVGKTSLGQSIARALGRKFIRIALGGVHDESEIRGHRRTYVGSLPGRIVQKLREVGTMNPVFMLDEIDKMSSDVKGDPASAMLEVLDPAQNDKFQDHYLNLTIDLSQVMFIATANELDRVPGPLRDRMEVIHLPGYLMNEKLEIARQYLVPRQITGCGINRKHANFQLDGLRTIVEEYTREAGVRKLEQRIGSVCRKIARKVAEGEDVKARINSAKAREILGPDRVIPEVANRIPEVGVSTGLAWSPVGGAILFIESTLMPGKGVLKLTGSLGEVMRESAELALSYIRANAADLGIASSLFTEKDVHIHFPEGATPKDGPSAGITIVTSLVSLMTGCPVRHDLAMTGEVSLRGRVLAIGGLREKVMAAHRAGVKTILAPRDNGKDLAEIPAEVRENLDIILVDHIDEVLAMALAGNPEQVHAALVN
ncbi:MAG: endopeptidase La [Candidatus Delongbacteria bacterium]|nr:endopeptidase La [Candidatus Delongbacteria bacterium]